MVADETIRMALARCQQVDGRIGLRIHLAAQPMADVEDIAAGMLGRRLTKARSSAPAPSVSANEAAALGIG